MGNNLKKYPDIACNAESSNCPLSFQQERVFYFCQLEPDSTLWDLNSGERLKGTIDVNLLKRAISKLMDRHTILKTWMRKENNTPVQSFRHTMKGVFKFIDLSNGTEPDPEAAAFKLMYEECQTPISSYLFEDSLFRIRLFMIAKNDYILLFSLHHIIADDTSLTILWRDLKLIYNSLLDPDTDHQLVPLKLSYSDYAQWQRSLFDESYTKVQEEYWLKQFAGDLPVLDLPTDFPPAPGISFNGGLEIVKLPKELMTQLQMLSWKNRVILFSTLFAAYYVLMQKYSGQTDIIIGTVFSGRQYSPDLIELAGFFINTAAVRMAVGDELGFDVLQKQVHGKIEDAYDMQDYPFERLVQKINPSRANSRIPLFRTMFNLVSAQKETVFFDKVEEESWLELATQTNATQVDLIFDIHDYPDDAEIRIEYNTDIFRKETVRRITRHYTTILRGIANNTSVKIKELNILEEIERQRLLTEWNGTETQYPRQKSIQQLFAEQVVNNAKDIAVSHDGCSTSYMELHEKSNQLANTLKSHGVDSQSIVGILTYRSIDMIIGILGILKAGGAYMPIDPSYPLNRISYMLKDSRTTLLLVQKQLLHLVDFSDTVVEIGANDSFEPDDPDVDSFYHAGALAYIMYTSGSTGNPKGVMVEHRSVIRLVKNTNYIQCDKNDRILQTGAPVFDATTFEIWMALLNGLQLFLVNEDVISNAKKLAQCIKANEITILWLTSPLFNQLSEVNPRIFAPLKYLLAGGDVLSPRHINQVRETCKDLQIINGYGPTENTTFSCCHKINKNYRGSIPIGSPISNSTVYILDKFQRPVPIGLFGELCVGGDGVARGYLNQPELTAEKFVENPFNPAEKIYKTGDLVKWLPDGTIEFIGRIDNQVKIRGFRIELGEIEARLLQHKDIKEAVVLSKTELGNEKSLCAYIATEHKISLPELRSHIGAELPDYMIPSYFIQVDKMPLNQNGKIDIKALSGLSGRIDNSALYVAPRNTTEVKLAQLWNEVLGLERIGIDDNFFELGGHSLKATLLMSKINKEFSVDISLKEIFIDPKIRSLAQYIMNSAQKKYPAIQVVEKKAFYPVSASQKRIYILNGLLDRKIEYNVPIALSIRGTLNRKRLQHVFNDLIKRHPSLRTSFKMVEGQMVQEVDAPVSVKIDYKTKKKESQINSIMKSFVKPFDLGKAPLIRICLVKIGKGRYILLIDMHHIICDGVSVAILFNEIAGLYRGDRLNNIAIQYIDYSDWQNRYLKSSEMQKQEAFWLNVLKGELPVLNLDCDYPRFALQSFAGDRVIFKAGAEISANLKNIAAANGATMYMILLAAYNILLSKFSSQEDILVGTPIAGRYHADVQHIVGMFVNTLVMRNMPVGKDTFTHLLKQVRTNSLNAYENQEYPFEELVEKLNVTRDLTRNPLFDTMFAVMDFGVPEMASAAVTFKEYELEYKLSKFDLSLTVLAIDQEIHFDLEYRTQLFKKSTIKRIAQGYLNILKQVSAQPDKKILEIDVIGGVEKKKILYEFNKTDAQYPRSKTIYELFEQQVQKRLRHAAIMEMTKWRSYQGLNKKSNQLARKLRENGVTTSKVVAIMMDRSIDMIVGILAILKAGGTFLPIDTQYPEARIKYILANTGVSCILIRGKMQPKIRTSANIIDLHDRHVFSGDNSNLTPQSASGDLAYIIYTSGSTGRPKGVMITHQGLVNYIYWAQKVYLKGEKINFPLYSSISFDLTMTSIFTPLISGNRVVIYNQEESAMLIQKIVMDNKVAIIKLTPTHLKLLQHINVKKSRIRKLIVGGEDLKTDLANRIYRHFNNRIEIFNEYGPTETVVGCMIYKFNPETANRISVPIGKPADNVQIYLLDKYLKPVPRGTVGEIYISGDGVARGYVNQPLVTRQSFMTNPFNHSGLMMYKTGDLAKLLANGNIEFIGRIDSQVKIRGFRIELGEIEDKLLQHRQIKETIVLARGELENTHLCAYLTATQEIPLPELRRYLAGQLPAYMIPSYFIQLEKMPFNRNGKIDTRALPEPGGKIDTGALYAAPRDMMEEKLVCLWQDELALDRIGIDDNFFELGGHSLKATVMIAKLNKLFGVNLSIKDLFDGPFIRKLTQSIKNAGQKSYSQIQTIEKKEYYTVSPGQKRIYILNRMVSEKIEYNVPVAINITGSLNRNRLQYVFDELIIRHESFRTSFEVVAGELVQKIHAARPFKLEYVAENNDVELNSIMKAFVQPFDLEQAPLLRVRLFKTGKNQHILLIDMHHIICDGVSVGVLFREIAQLYRGDEPEASSIQYKDYSVWQNQYLKSVEMQKQDAFWLDVLKGELPVLNMPTDYPRLSLQSFAGDRVMFRANEETSAALKRLSITSGATLYMVLLAAYNVLLSKYCNQQDILVGTPIVGRYHVDVQRLVGMFVNILVMRNNPNGELTFEQLLSQVRSNALSAYENQECQFEELVEKLAITRDLSRNPLFDTILAPMDPGIKELEIEGLTFKELEPEYNISKFDLSLITLEQDKEISFEFEFSSKLFKRSTVQRMSRHYIFILEQIVKEQNKKLADITLLTIEEKQQILYRFNDTYTDYPREKTIPQLFEEQVDKTTDHMALVYEESVLTYRELNRRANRLACVIRERVMNSSGIVGIMVQPSLQMIIGILAILKADEAYLPISPRYPEERIKYMLADCGAQLLLSDQIEAKTFGLPVIDLMDHGLYQGQGIPPKSRCHSNELAYVIYTSGTTGKPKGVMISHRSLHNLCTWHNQHYDVSSKDRSTKYADFGFDASVWEIFPYLLAGAALYIIDEDLRLNIDKLNAYFEARAITMGFLPTQICEQFMVLNNTTLRKLLTGGDKLRQFTSTNYQLVNNYGPTENTVVTTSFPVHQNFNNIPIGRPISNIKIYILGRHDELQPIGISGELCIAGESLAIGYINSIEQTTKKFVPNPFEPGEMMYRTGDKARWLSDGNIEFIERMDNQVKIRGLRIELGEIEARLLNHPDIIEAVVLAKEQQDQDKYLCAYIVADKEVSLNPLRDYLGDELPDYMIPPYIIQIDLMPLNPSGKIDTKALPGPEGIIDTGPVYVAPQNMIEEKLARLWQEVLSIERVGLDDNFFELGGHSLKATVLMSKINKEFSVDISLKDIFNDLVIRKLAHRINNSVKKIYPAIQSVATSEYYPVTPTQKVLYAVCSTHKGVEYNLPMAINISGDLNAQQLEYAFKTIIKRHESLRSSFHMVAGQLMQKVHDDIPFELEFQENDEKEIDQIMTDFLKPFNLSEVPLIKAKLIKIKDQRFVLMLDMHHLVTDGTSMGLFFDELEAFYEGKSIPEPRVQFKDFSAWLSEYLKTEEIKKQEEYWLEVFAGELPVLELYSDYPRPKEFSFEGNRANVRIDMETNDALRKITIESGSTIYMMLLAAYNLLLSKYSGDEDIIVGMPLSGRYHADIHDVMGMFVNTHAIRNKPRRDLSFREFLSQLRLNALNAFENQECQFWDVLGKLFANTTLKSLFNTVFIVQNMDLGDIEIPGLVFKERLWEFKISKFDLTLGAVEHEDGLEFEFEYSTRLFKKSTADRIANHYIFILKQIIENQDKKLADFKIVTPEEEEQILYQFNNTQKDYPLDKTIQMVLEEQVKKTPDQIALVYEDQELTYNQLNKRTNQLARLIRKKGVIPDQIVGIMVRPSLEMIIGIVAILKSGGAYLPISLKYPDKRIDYMLQDSAAGLLLTDNGVGNNFKGTSLIDLKDQKNYQGAQSNLRHWNKSHDLAYVIYTSGTTGKPKGVMVEHKSLLNLCYWHNRINQVRAGDRSTKYADFGFDASVWEIFPYLIAGASLYIIDEEIKLNIRKLNDYFETKGITLSFLPTQVCERFMELNNNSLRKLLTGGDELKQFKKKNYQLVNNYGPTENAVVTTSFPLKENYRDIPIGSPVSNTKVYIMGRDNQLMPVGVVGELCISGAGLARGYLNSDESTAEAFKPSQIEPGERVYRTGDMARWLPDGNVEFIGRIDQQVKIRGFRIEINEIEKTLISHPGIKEVAVFYKKENPPGKQLIAFMVFNPDVDLADGYLCQLQSFLGHWLPDYMIPSVYMKVDRLPVNLSGKIDKEALPIPQYPLNPVEYAAPETVTEQKIVDIAERVLNIAGIGVNDNFLHLGGNSLQVMKLISSIEEVFGTSPLAEDIMKAPKICQIAKQVQHLSEL
jgi:tyrocidine synthetase III